MQRALRVVHCCVLFCAVLFEGWTSNAQGQSVNVLGGTPSHQRIASPSIPGLPQQTAVWNAPETKLPKEFASAACTLFRQGLADPRGCQYCAIELSAGNHVSGDDRVISTHGWLIPPGATEGPCFAICWNGVVYPAVTRKGGADLRADVLNAVKAEWKAREASLTGIGGLGASRLPPATKAALKSPRCAINRPSPCGPVSFCGWARSNWRRSRGLRALRTNQGLAARRKHPRIRTWILARDWTWSLFHREVYAHMCGDDRVALPAAKTLVPILKAVEAEAAKRKYPQPTPAAWEHGKPSYLEEISCIGELLVDQERRATLWQAGKLLPVMPAPGDDPEVTRVALRQALQQCPDEAHRIELLVQELEEVSAQETDNGGLDFASDPVVSLLIQEGEAAVEPLLACLENDTRLTRSVHFSCDYNTLRYRQLVGVSEAAYVTLADILGTDFFGNVITRDDLTSRGKPGRMALAKRIRDYFNKYKGLPREERWYRILLDDRPDPPMGRGGGKRLSSRPTPRRRLEALLSQAGSPADPQAGRGGQAARRSMRRKSKPSVTEILQQRIRELPAEMARDVAMALADWDPKAAVPVLVGLTENLPPPRLGTSPRTWPASTQRRPCPSYADLPKNAGRDRRPDKTALCERPPGWQPFVDLIVTRMAIHDRQALKEYAQWIPHRAERTGR